MNQMTPIGNEEILLSAEASRISNQAAEKALVRRLAAHCNRFRDPDDRRALFEVAVTVIPFLLIGAAMIWLAVGAEAAIGAWRWLALLVLAPVEGAFLVRLFAIQHDCGHGSLTSSRTANRWIGRFLSLFTFTPYALWQRAHAVHHGASGNLDKRGTGDIDTRTLAEYEAMTPRQRLAYRIYRNPWVLIFLGVPLYFLIVHRLPYTGAMPRMDGLRSAGGLDLALLAFYGLLVWLAGWTVLLAVLPVVVIGAWIGGWLFYMQHQFEETSWDQNEEWDLHVAAFGGSSWYVMPPIAQWFTGSIGLHHIHHLCSRVPFYKLQACFDSNQELQDASEKVRLTFGQSLACVNLALWDEGTRRLITFAEARAMRPQEA